MVSLKVFGRIGVLVLNYGGNARKTSQKLHPIVIGSDPPMVPERNLLLQRSYASFPTSSSLVTRGWDAENAIAKYATCGLESGSQFSLTPIPCSENKSKGKAAPLKGGPDLVDIEGSLTRLACCPRGSVEKV
jgi:hypothetical protein